MVRPPLFLDACVRGAVAEGLLRRGWDAVRTGQILDAFDQLAALKDPFHYPIYDLKPLA